MTYSVSNYPYFQKQLEALEKTYPRVRDDIKETINQLESNPLLVGRRVPSFGDKHIRHIRVGSKDIGKGKRSGFRIEVFIDEEKKEIFPLCIYPKKEADKTPLVKGVLRALKGLEDE